MVQLPLVVVAVVVAVVVVLMVVVPKATFQVQMVQKEGVVVLQVKKFI